jgi:hypothetical protein
MVSVSLYKDSHGLGDTMKITQDEYQDILFEISERIKDVWEINLLSKLIDALPKKYIEGVLDSDEWNELAINHDFTIVVNDLKQILGRSRRK